MKKSIGRREQDVLQSLLRRCRLEASLTQRQVAERLQTGHSRIADYEAGERRLDLLQARDLLGVMGVSLADFAARLEQEIAALPAEAETEPGALVTPSVSLPRRDTGGSDPAPS